MSRFTQAMQQMTTVKAGWDSIWLKSMESRLVDSVEKDTYKKSEIVYTCISHTSRSIGQVPLQILQPSSKAILQFRNNGSIDGKAFMRWKRSISSLSFTELGVLLKDEQLEPVPASNPYQELIYNPNPMANGQLFMESLVGFLMLDGNVWIAPLPLGPMDGSMLPDSLWAIKRARMSPKKDDRGRLLSWSFGVEELQNTVELSPEEVAQIKFWNPYDEILGLAPMEAGKLPITTDWKAAKYNEKFFDHGAVPRGVLTTEGKINDGQFKRLKEQFSARHTGYKQAHRIAVLQKGLKYDTTGLSQKDMEFKELRNYDRDSVMRIFGTKKAIIGEELNYAQAREQRKTWWHDTNIPIMRLIANAFNTSLLLNTPFVARFDISSIEALHEEYKDKVNTAHKLWQMGFTGNEINSKLELGFDNQPWRDVAYVPVNLIPTGPDGQHITPEDEKTITINQTYQLENKQGLIEVKDNSNERNENIWKGYVRRLGPIEGKFRKKVERVFFDMRRKSLDLLYNDNTMSLKDLSDLIDELNFATEKQMLEKLTAPLYDEALSQGVESLATETGIDISFTLEDPMAIEFMASKISKIGGVTDTINRQVTNEISQAMAAGESVDEVAERLRKVFGFARNRARTIARTEVIGSSNFGRYGQLQRSGFREKEWFTAKDEAVRDDHWAMQGTMVLMNDVWVMPDGSSLRYPGDSRGPAKQVINCRCIELAAVSKR